MIALFERHHFHPNKEMFLAFEKSDTEIELRHWRPVPGGKILYANLSWVVGIEVFFLNIEYNEDSKKLGDSTRWNADNEYLGGHIQSTHNYRGSEETFFQRAHVLLSHGSNWTTLAEDQSAFA